MNAIIEKINDQFAEELSPQMKTAIAMSDALFGGIVKARTPTAEDRLDEMIALANRLELLCGRLALELADDEIDECRNFALDIARNISAVRARLSAKPCACGKCDVCVAARSDAHYDRKRDGS